MISCGFILPPLYALVGVLLGYWYTGQPKFDKLHIEYVLMVGFVVAWPVMLGLMLWYELFWDGKKKKD